jgi:hypothetical protein
MIIVKELGVQLLELDSTAENLVIAVFDEFLGCAVSTKFFYFCEPAN